MKDMKRWREDDEIWANVIEKFPERQEKFTEKKLMM